MTDVTAYNADRQIASIADNYSHYAYTYDGQGNVASVDNAGTPGVPDVLLSSQYDAAGNRSSLSATIAGMPDFLNTDSYNTLSQLDLIDQQGQTGGNAVAPKSIYFGLDAIGDINEIDRANSVAAGPNQSGPAYSLLSYNPQGQLTGINHEYMGASLDNLTYTFDTLGRVHTFTSIDGTATYAYDPTSQLISATYTTATGGTQPPNLSLSFDPNGNRSSVNGTSTTVGADNHLASDGIFNFTYDPAGNLITRVRIFTASADDYKTVYDWDYRNRLTDVYFYDNGDALKQHVHYVYDVFDNLIERDLDPTGGGTYTQIVHYVWGAPESGGAAGIVLAFNGSDQLIARYLNGPSTSAYDQFFTALAEEDVSNVNSAGTVYYYLLDASGSLTDIVGSNGALDNHVTYTAFGQDFHETNPSVTHIVGYAGGLYDPVTGLVYYIERWYDPLATVWISADPTGLAGGDVNTSRYVGNEPTVFIDATGLAKQRPVTGETRATKSGKSAHKGFADAAGGTGNVVLPTGEIADCVKETPKRITIDELKPTGRVMKEGVLQGSKYNAAVRQVEGYAAAIPNPQGKPIYVRLWGWVQDGATKRFKYMKLKGWRYVAKAAPGVGTAIAAASYGRDVQAKGAMGGTVNTALDACPGVGTGKFFFEIFIGEDIVPEASTRLPWYSRLLEHAKAARASLALSAPLIYVP